MCFLLIQHQQWGRLCASFEMSCCILNVIALFSHIFDIGFILEYWVESSSVDGQMSCSSSSSRSSGSMYAIHYDHLLVPKGTNPPTLSMSLNGGVRPASNNSHSSPQQPSLQHVINPTFFIDMSPHQEWGLVWSFFADKSLAYWALDFRLSCLGPCSHSGCSLCISLQNPYNWPSWSCSTFE